MGRPKTKTTTKTPTKERWVGFDEVLERLDTTKRQVYRWIDKGLMPKPFRPNGGKNKWTETDIDAVVNRTWRASPSSDDAR